MSMLRYWIWLSELSGVSLRGKLRLVDHFGGPEEVFMADEHALEQVEGLSQKERKTLLRRDLRCADGVLEDCRTHQIHVLTIQDAAYPGRLRNTETPPLVLYYKGTMLPFDELPVITVVGSRKASAYGLTTAKRMGYQLASCGATVVSGAARGIDSLALEGAMTANAPVAAVLGNGLDIVYPTEAKRLYEDVAARGCLISEFAPGTPPLAQNFPQRNRIMSALSLGVLVVEAAKKSGSLITADLALEQGRDVYAVPGNVGLDCCAGSNQLLQEGAGLVTCGWDVLQNYQGLYPNILRRKGGGEITLSPRDGVYIASGKEEKNAKTPAEPEPTPQRNSEKRIDNEPKRNYIDLKQIRQTLSEDEGVLVELLVNGKLHVDDIIDRSEMPPARVLASLTLLEVKGIVTRYSGNIFELHEA